MNSSDSKSISLDFLKEWVSQRVSSKRFQHIAGVASISRQLAEQVGCDPLLAQVAAWLHDSCKEMKDEHLVKKALESGLELSEIEKKHGHLLHGPVAAIVIREELGITNEDVLQAVSQHTLGFVPMSTLSKVVFLADCLEEGRPKDFTDPIWQALSLGEENNLDKAIVVACDLSLRHLISVAKPIHPLSVAVRNYYLER